ncbi:hypothetical protein UFOVP336_22 [uncultured Caudovirales phage]|uniref:Uncharacterized protein n=1 Tax=uncultured Caudovirales phage TaxID=2100421 RepID=A0A6J5LXD0_9CAUD|nr:hypothetical protein UFOVP336_22 [uncultured Caudovirales phage]
MNKQDENELTENWHSDTNCLNEKIDDFFKRAQDHAYALGLARGLKEAAAVAVALPLSDEQIDALDLQGRGVMSVRDMVRLVEQEHGIGIGASGEK